MAWHDGGNWGSSSQDKGGTILAQLGKGINDRENSINKAKTVWPAPVSGADPVPTDFDGEKQSEYLGTGDQEYIAALKTAIGNLVPKYKNSGETEAYWSTSSGSATTFTSLEDLLGAGSYGLSFVTPANRQDPSLLLQMREALDFLKYPLVYLGIDSSSDRQQNNLRRGIDPAVLGSDYEIAWDNAKADSPEQSSLNPLWRIFRGPPNNATANIKTSRACDSLGFYTDNLGGTVVRGYVGFVTYYFYQTSGSSHGLHDDVVFRENVGSNDITILANSTEGSAFVPDTVDVFAVGSGWPTLGSKTVCPTLSVVTAEPANQPFYHPGFATVYGGAVLAQLSVLSSLDKDDGDLDGIYRKDYSGTTADACHVRYDITSELTYG